MANINSIEINQFRGIRQLTISNISKINLIVGDNNSGKTTFLEAVQLLFAKSQLSSVKNIIKQRTVLNVSESSFYTSFIKMFNVNQESELLDFDIYAVSNNGPIRFEMRGRERTISGEEALQMSTMSLGQKAHYKKESTVVPETAKLFSGSIISQSGKKPIEKDIHFTSLDNVSVGPVIKREVQYIPSFGHLRYDLLKNFVDNPEYKKLAISILKQFDDSIVDICYTKADDGCFLESIITADGINMPFSSVMVVTDRDEDSISKIRRRINDLFENILYRAGEWINNEIKDSFGQPKQIDTYLLIVPMDKKGALENVIIDALRDIPEEKALIEEVIGFIDSLKEEVVPELSRINSANKATVGTFFSVRDPKHAMRSFATYVSKIDWSKSESLNEMFLPFMDLGTTKELYM